MLPRSSASVVIVAMELIVSCELPAVVHGEDDRAPLFLTSDRQTLNPDTGLDNQTGNQLRAVGALLCRDGTKSTAFLIDSSSMLRQGVEPPLIVATASHALFDEGGASRGKCWFRQDEWRFFALSDIRVGSRRTQDVDARDWAFARVAARTRSGKSMDTAFRLEIEFEDLYDFDREQASPRTFLNVSFMPEHGMVGVARNCQPGSKQRYPWFREGHHDWSRMIIHDCDFLRAGSGGPLLMSTPDGYRVIGLNVGEADPERAARGDVIGAEFNPPRTFNYARRFDRELRHQLLHFLERLAGRDNLLAPP